MGAERLIPVLAIVVLATACQGGGTDGDREQATGENVVVRNVNDGDTLTLENGLRVRLLQVDAPELTTECYGRDAARALSAFVPRKSRVRLVSDPRLDDQDRFGRLLRYVFLGSTNVNVGLVRRGAASPYFFRNDRGRYADELVDAVDDARDARRGFWGACPRAELNTGLGSITGPAR